MRQKIAMFLLLLLGLLIACNGKEELVEGNPDYVEEGYGVLKLTLKNSIGTKAVGDALTGDDDITLTGEKEVKDVAFFIHTENTEDGNGNFQAYFSEEQAADDDFMDLTTDEGGNCATAILRFRSDAWKNPQVMVIANYKENGTLEKQLKDINSWEELENVTVNAVIEDPNTPEIPDVPDPSPVSVPAATPKGPACPLLMYTLQTIDQWKMTDGRVGGGPATVTFDLQRLVSRIDIRNYANLATVDADRRFVLEQVEIVNQNSDPALMATVEKAPILGEIIVYPGESISVDENDGHQYINGLYVYENLNTESSTATYLRIKGKIDGKDYQKTIPFQTQLAPVEPIALKRNHRYVVNIHPEAERQDISFSVEVLDWNEGETIYAQPSFPAPVWAAISTPTSGFSWTANTKTLKITAATTSVSGEIKFKTTGNCATSCDVFYRYDYGGTSLTDDGSSAPKNPDWVTRETPRFSFESSKVETEYKVTIPSQFEAELVPLDILVCTKNANSNTYNDTLVISYRPEYTDAAHSLTGTTGDKQPYLVGGKFWAPVNLGATMIIDGEYRMPQAIMSEEACNEFSAYNGLFYQWGRPVGFGGDITSKTTMNTAAFTSDRAITYTSGDAEKFIKISGDWCSNPELLGDARWNAGTTAKPQKVTNDPCPRGWRIPTSSEMSVFTSAPFQEGIKKVPEDNSSRSLFLPASGFYSGGFGAGDYGGLGAIYVTGRYYVSDKTLGENGYARSYLFGSGSGGETCYAASACPIRCVQNDGPEIVIAP